MDTRLSVKLEGTNKWYGDDHKLYFYTAYENVKESFDIIYPYILEQEDEDGDDFYKWLASTYPENPQKETYDFLCTIGGPYELIIPDDVFKIFTEKYLKELKNAGKDEDVIKNVTQYLTELANQAGNKILEWG